MLEPSLQLELNAEQLRLKRGLSFPITLARGFGVLERFLERDVTADSLLLRRDAWDALPRTAQFDWLEWYVTQDGHDCRSTSLREHPDFHRALQFVGWSPQSGPNCFATALSYGEPNPTRAQNIARLWLPIPTFERTLAARGFIEQAFTHDLEPGWILAWRDSSGVLVHACICVARDLVLNKDAQAWYSPRQILALQTVLERWDEDGLERSVFVV